ncbi:MAG: N-acetyltransferase [Coriobacteriales bacterium]|jgi:UDP-2-acetamido-3-amino-2,3-dideoxy-glucuronate N-acetyltransferase|nr:N-acetyltransferase [Coriobacteriales bacterium]
MTNDTSNTRMPHVDPSVFIHDTALVDAGAHIGPKTKIWHFSHIQSGAQIGSGCSFGQNVYIANDVRVGNDCKVQNNVSLYDGITLQDEVFLGPSCVFTNDFYPRAHSDSGWQILPTLVKRGASVGANATIVCGNTIGEYALIGSGSVVTHDVPAYALVVGVPARQIGWVCRCGSKLIECQTERQAEYQEVKTVRQQPVPDNSGQADTFGQASPSPLICLTCQRQYVWQDRILKEA